MSIRPVRSLSSSQPTLEGAGVKLRRAFGFNGVEDFDPFLLLDDFRNNRPEDYAAGFPWHPHRGIETVTYVLAGSVEHADSLGNEGRISAGDIQWMTAGRGILHQEMPHGDAQGRMHGFQLWVNLPSSLKMSAPRYQEFNSETIPVVTDDNGVIARIISGQFWGRRGPVEGLAASPRFLDIQAPPECFVRLPVDQGISAFAYIFEGSASFRHASPHLGVLTEVAGEESGQLVRKRAGNHSLVLFDSGNEIAFQSGENGVRFLLVSGSPIREPIAWRGPIVMNTQTELEQAFSELRSGNFIKSV